MKTLAPSRGMSPEEMIVHSANKLCSDGPAPLHYQLSPPPGLLDTATVPYALAHPGLDIPLLNQSAVFV